MINNINKLSEVQFIKCFSNIFENSQFVAEALYKKKGDGFGNFEDLVKKMMNVFENTTKEQKLKILNAHPDLADKAKIGSLTTDSKNEQSSVGLDKCTLEEFNEFKNLNFEYKKKFGFPFIFAVKNKSKLEKKLISIVEAENIIAEPRARKIEISATKIGQHNSQLKNEFS